MAANSRVRLRGRPAKDSADNVYLAPRMVVGSSEQAVYMSKDGRRQTNHIGSPQKKQCVERDYEPDRLESWESADSWHPGCGEGMAGVEGYQDAIESVVINKPPDDKAKRYMNSISVYLIEI
jgi:hypothetical protein